MHSFKKNLTISMGQESRHGLDGFFAVGSHQAVIKVLSGAVILPHAQGPLLSSLGYGRIQFLVGCETETLSS